MKEANQTTNVVKKSSTRARSADETGLVYNLTRIEIEFIFDSYFGAPGEHCTIAMLEVFETIRERQRKGEIVEFEIFVSETLSIIGAIDKARSAIERCNRLNKSELTKEEIDDINSHLEGIVEKINEKNVYNFISEAMSLPFLIRTERSCEHCIAALGCVLRLYIAYERSLACDNPNQVRQEIIDYN
jgi:hypothetical protein